MSLGSDYQRTRLKPSVLSYITAADVGTTIAIPPTGDHVDAAADFVDNYDIDGADDYTLCEKMVHYCGGGIVRDHWAACKAVLVFYAGESLSKLSTMTKTGKEAAMMELYTSAIAELDEMHFGDNARVFFSRSFQKKDDPITGLSLYRYYLDSRSKMRNHLIPLFPKDFVTMKSGRGFHESCNDVYTKAFRDEQSVIKVKRNKVYVPKYTEEEIAALVPPHLWEYSKAPWLFGLCIKIFRRNPHLAPDVVEVFKDVSNVTVSRAVLKRQKQEAAAVSKGTSNSSGSSVISTTSRSIVGGGVVPPVPIPAIAAVENATTKKLLWAKVLASKSQAENTNIAKRMGKMEELEKAMTLLDKMRKVIGEDNYKARVVSVLDAFPVFSSFDACVDIIDVDADDDDAGSRLPSTAASGKFRTPLTVRVNTADDGVGVEDSPASVEDSPYDCEKHDADYVAPVDLTVLLAGGSDITDDDVDDDYAAEERRCIEKEHRLREDNEDDADVDDPHADVARQRK